MNDEDFALFSSKAYQNVMKEVKDFNNSYDSINAENSTNIK